MLSTVRACFALLPRGLQLAWLGLVPLLAAGALVELAAAAALYAILARAVAPPGAVVPALPFGAALGRGGGGLAAAALGLGALFLLKNLWLAAVHLAQSWLLGSSMSAAFRRLTGAWLAAPFAQAGRGRSADLIHDATEGLGVAFRSVMSAAASVLAEILVILAIGALLAWTSPGPVLASALLLGIVLFGCLAATRRLTQRWGAAGFERGRRVVVELQQMAAGLREIKSFRRERHFLGAATAVHGESMAAFRKHTALAGMPRLLVETIFVAAAITAWLLMAKAAGAAAGAGMIPLFALFAYAGFRIIPSVNRIVLGLDEARHGAAAVAQLGEHLRSLGTLGSCGLLEPAQPAPPARNLAEGVELVGVSHRRPGSERPALVEVSLRLRRGAALGVVGPTGAGKSTLLDLLAGLIEPSAGHVLVDGEPLRDWIASGGVIGYVPQAPWLLDDNVARNVAFGLPDAEIDRPRLAWAITAAGLDAVVDSWPAGVDEPIGETGQRLSGGERQRLAIARALYHAPQLLVLDEATSALDAATEARVLANIRTTGTTLVIAAHRLEALRFCDELLVLDEGRAVARGGWGDLEDREPLFRSLLATARQPPAA